MLFLKIDRDVVLSLFFVLAFCFCAGYFYFSNLNLILIYTLIPFILFIIKPIKINFKLLFFPSLIFYIFLLETIFFSEYFRKEEAILWLCVAYSSFFYAYFMYINRYRILVNKFFLLIYGVCIWYFIVTVILGINNLDIYNNILPGYSRNVLSAIMIFLTFNLALSYYQEDKRIPLFFVFFCFLTCLFLLGRSGIFISAAFLFFHLFFYYKKSILLLLLLFIGACFLFFGFDPVAYFQDQSNFKKGLESSRTQLIEEYLTGLFYNNKSVFWGRNFYECCSLTMSYGGNIHNSFLSGHAKYGVLHTIFVCFIFASIFICRKWYLTLIASLIFVRYFYDQMGFFGVYDISILYLILILLMNKAKMNN